MKKYKSLNFFLATVFASSTNGFLGHWSCNVIMQCVTLLQGMASQFECSSFAAELNRGMPDNVGRDSAGVGFRVHRVHLVTIRSPLLISLSNG